MQLDDVDLLVLDDGSFQFVLVKKFSIDPAISDDELLSSLIAAREYDPYDVPQRERISANDTHGPYWLSAIAVESFRPATTERAVSTILRWADEPWAVDGPDAAETETDVPPTPEEVLVVELSGPDDPLAVLDSCTRSTDDGDRVSIATIERPALQSASTHAQLAKRVYPALAAPVLYELPMLPAEIEHDNAVNAYPFIEYVAVDRDSATLTLIIASDD